MKKGTKRKNHQDYNDELEEVMQREIDNLTKPNLSHLLACRLVVGTAHLVIHLPHAVKWAYAMVHERIDPPAEEEECDGTYSPVQVWYHRATNTDLG